VVTASATLPDGPPRTLLWGNLRELASDRLGGLTAYAREYGDVVPLRLGFFPYVLVSHPALIEEVLVNENRNFVKGREYRLNRLTLGRGLLTSEGSFWLRQRRLVQPAFRRESVRRHAPEIVAAAERIVGRWEEDEPQVDLLAAMLRIALDAAARTLFGADLAGREADIFHGLEAALLRFRERFDSVFALPDSVPTPRNVRLRRAIKRLDRTVYSLIAERREGRHADDDLLALLLAASEDGAGMTDVQLRDEVVTLMLAGHETTANALVWTWYLLARNPDCDRRVGDEVTAVLGERAPTAADVPNLRYTDLVVREALRLYPPSWGITRQAVREVTLGGYRLRAGTHVAMCQWIVHRDPRWFDEPERFQPERWNETRPDLPRYAYFPFGGGQRLCVGSPFAMLELILVVASIAQRFRLELMQETDATPVAGVTLRPRETLLVNPRRR
jgi:cytochrome P450